MSMSQNDLLLEFNENIKFNIKRNNKFDSTANITTDAIATFTQLR